MKNHVFQTILESDKGHRDLLLDSMNKNIELELSRIMTVLISETKAGTLHWEVKEDADDTCVKSCVPGDVTYTAIYADIRISFVKIRDKNGDIKEIRISFYPGDNKTLCYRKFRHQYGGQASYSVTGNKYFDRAWCTLLAVVDEIVASPELIDNLSALCECRIRISKESERERARAHNKEEAHE